MATSFYQGSFGSELPALTLGDQCMVTKGDEQISRFNRASADIAYGLAVVRDNSEPLTGAILPTAVTQNIIGVAVNANTSILPLSSNARLYADDDNMTIQAVGAVAMEAGAAITADDPVYIETSGADAGKPFPATNAVAGSYTLTLNKALAQGVGRIQTLTFAGDLVTSNTVNATLNGVAIAQVTFMSNHATTMGFVRQSFIDAAIAQGLDVSIELTDQGGTNRVITFADLRDFSPTTTAVASIVVAAGATQTTGAMADVVAGIDPAAVSVSVNAVTVSTTWDGTSESTMLAFAQELESQAGVSSADLSSSGLVLTLASSIPLTLASGLVTGGEATPATLTAATGSGGVAGTRILWSNARFLGSAADGSAVGVRFDARF